MESRLATLHEEDHVLDTAIYELRSTLRSITGHRAASWSDADENPVAGELKLTLF